jgi:hypothetical protein
MKFRSHFMDSSGTWKTTEVPGPEDYSVWEAGYEVFKHAAVADGICHLATLNAYQSEFKERVMLYPGCWHIAAEADVRARSEHVLSVRRRLEVDHGRDPTRSNFEPLMPWNSAFKELAKDTAFWDRVMEKPALRYQLHGPKAVPAFAVHGGVAAGYMNTEFTPPPPPNNPGPGQGKKRKQREAFEARKGKGKGDKSAKRKDGRFVMGRCGSQICYEWGRVKDGCKEPCPHGRLHCCEFDLQPHRTTHCRAHPNWTPPAKGAGK